MSAKLGVRAVNVLENWGISKPDDLVALAQASGLSVRDFLMTIPNCGRKTVMEIIEWSEDGNVPQMPTTVWLHILHEFGRGWYVAGYSETPRDEKGWFAFCSKPNVDPPQK